MRNALSKISVAISFSIFSIFKNILLRRSVAARNLLSG
jgi:hypothetical protein